MSAQPEPPTGRAVPEAIVPRDKYTAAQVVGVADTWWRDLTPEQRVGLWTRYGDLGARP